MHIHTQINIFILSMHTHKYMYTRIDQAIHLHILIIFRYNSIIIKGPSGHRQFQICLFKRFVRMAIALVRNLMTAF